MMLAGLAFALLVLLLVEDDTRRDATRVLGPRRR